MKLLLIALVSLLCSSAPVANKKCKVKKATVKKAAVIVSYTDFITNKYMF
jgi:hypothetical protein